METKASNNRIHLRNSKAHFGVFDLVVYLFCFLDISTLFTQINPYSSLVNKVFIGVYLIFAMVMLCTNLTLRSLAILLLLLFVELITLQNTTRPLYNINDSIYLPLWVITLVMFAENYTLLRKKVLEHYRLYKFTGMLWLVIMLFSLVFSSSFSMRGFVSFSGGEHRFAETCLFACCCFYIDYFVTGKKHDLFCLAAVVVAVFATNARTYIIVVLAVVLFGFLKLGTSLGVKRLMFFSGLIVVVFIAYYLARVKIDNDANSWGLQNRGALYVITSGRSYFWAAEIRHFFSETIGKILFGNGYNYVYDVNSMYVGAKIWAHNDYLNVLLASGFLGLYVYLLCFCRFLKAACRRGDPKRINVFLFIFAIFFNAMFNMVYTYTIANIVTPLLGMIMIDTDYFLLSREQGTI